MSAYSFAIQNLDFDSRLPKYRQVVNVVIRDIRKSILRPGVRIPSINEASSECYLSRDTVEKAYRELTRRGLIHSIPGKGFFVSEQALEQPPKVLAVFDRLDGLRWQLYEALSEQLGPEIEMAMVSYEHNYRLLNLTLEEHADDYDYFLVIPHFFAYQDDLKRALDFVPPHRLIVLTHPVTGLSAQAGGITFDRAREWEQALTQAQDKIAAYERLLLFFPEDFLFPQEILESVQAYCQHIGLPFKVLHAWSDHKVKPGDLCIVLEDDTLVALVQHCQQHQWRPGADVGIIAYEDHPAKADLADGITVLAHDYQLIARETAAMIRQRTLNQQTLGLQWVWRNSFS